jgi:acetyl coenzyme A synthetase (ADP forming)-like protein
MRATDSVIRRRSMTTRAAGDARDVILRDGRTLRLRPPAEEDARALLEFIAGLSEQSRLLRFHGFRAISPELIAPFVAGDGVDRGGLLGSVAVDGGERVVALATWARLRDRGSAEVAFAVDDSLQGIGVGTRLLEQLAAVAGGAGIDTFVAEVLPENRGMLRVFEDAGFDVARALEGGTIEVRFPIEPTAAYRERVDERDHVAVVASLRPFFAPRNVAVVGASARAGSIGGTIVRNIVDGGFAGRVYPVNRSGRPVAGVAAVGSFEEIDESVDLAVIAVPAASVLDAAADALGAGTRALCVISAGFAETGTEGAELQQRLLAAVRAHGARLIGPNCLGVAVAGSRLNATFARGAFPRGAIGFASQSGALGLALLEALGGRGLGLSAFVSMGNKADVSSNDLLEWWLDDPETDLVLLYLESFGNPRKFGRVARRLASRKPVLAVKSGTSRAGARAASSHTAALAGSEAAVDALFRQAGVTRAGSLEELLDVAALYASGAAPRGRRVGVLTNAGGLGILCADACEAAGLELPELSAATVARLAGVLPGEAGLGNPVDMLGSATASTYAGALPLLLADPGLDAVVVLFVPAASVEADEVATAIAQARPPAPDKPVLAVVMSERGTPASLRQVRGIAGFSYPESAARALGRVAERADWLRRPLGRIPDVTGVDGEAARRVVSAALVESDDRWLTPDEARALLAAYGLPIVPERTASSSNAAVEAAAELGYPVVVKTAIAGVHKTEIAGVELDLDGADAVRAAADRIGAPLVVQPMIRGGVELLAGIVQDPLFGPLVAFGAGGRLAELIGEVGFRIAPLTEVDAHELVDEGKGGRLVRGFRGAPAADAHALTDLLHRLSRLGEERPEVAELDLNPVLAFPDRCVCVDARARVRRVSPGASLKTW